jgi:hypothetical protein
MLLSLSTLASHRLHVGNISIVVYQVAVVALNVNVAVALFNPEFFPDFEIPMLTRNDPIVFPRYYIPKMHRFVYQFNTHMFWDAPIPVAFSVPVALELNIDAIVIVIKFNNLKGTEGLTPTLYNNVLAARIPATKHLGAIAIDYIISQFTPVHVTPKVYKSFPLKQVPSQTRRGLKDR